MTRDEPHNEPAMPCQHVRVAMQVYPEGVSYWCLECGQSMPTPEHLRNTIYDRPIKER